MARAQVELIGLGNTREEVVARLGQPLEKTVRGEVEIYTYSSFAGSLADYIYFKNNGVVLVSRSYAGQEVKQQQVFTDLGVPEKTYVYAVGNRGTESQDRFLSWYTKGTAVQLEGVSSTNVLERTLVFTPMSEQEFFALWSPSQHLTEQEVIYEAEERSEGIADQEGSAAAETDLITIQQNLNENQGGFSQRALLPIAGGVIVGFLILGVVFWVVRRKLLAARGARPSA